MSCKKKNEDILTRNSGLLPSPNKLARTDGPRADDIHEHLNKNTDHVSHHPSDCDYIDLENEPVSDLPCNQLEVTASVSEPDESTDALFTQTESLWIAETQDDISTEQPEEQMDPAYSSCDSIGLYQFQQDTIITRDRLNKPGSQQDNCTSFQTCSRANGVAYAEGANELDDLLYHFQNFFQSRLDAEVRTFHESLCSILQEQQNHVRQIVHTAMRENSSQVSSDDLLYEDSALGSSNTSSGTDMEVTQLMPDVPSCPVPPVSDEATCSVQQLANLESSNCTTRKKQKLLELVVTACSVSTLLAKPQFRT